MYPGGNEDRLVMPFGPITGQAAITEQPDTLEATVVTKPSPPPRVLQYELVDLLKLEGIGERESEAIWTLVSFLSAGKKTEPLSGPKG